MTTSPGAAAGPPGSPPVHLVHHLEDVMGTIVVIDVYATADGAAGRASQEISGS